MFGFRLPGLGRSDSNLEWTIEGHHLAERCQLFIIVALGETILITGSTLSELEAWGPPVIIAALVAFVGSLAMWWVYFDTSSKAGSHAITHAKNPGQMGAWFHYIHVVLVGAIIVCAVANERVIAHPDERMEAVTVAVLILGPAVYILANAIYKRIVHDRFPLSHLIGLIAFGLLTPLAFRTDLLMVNGLTTVILVAIGIWESLSRGATAAADDK